MKDSPSSKKPYINIPSCPIPFNQQSTKSLLKQLELSIYDVEQIIKKSKESLGLKQKSPRQLTQSRTRDFSEINFNMSLAQSSLQEQLTYSISPQTKSRIHNQQNQLNSSRNSNNIVRKLAFQQEQKIKKKEITQTSLIKNLRTKSGHLLKTSPTILSNMPQMITEKKSQKQDINQLSPIQYNNQNIENEKRNFYDSSYSIVNKGYTKNYFAPLQKIQQAQDNSKNGSTLTYQYRLLNNNQTLQKPSISPKHKKIQIKQDSQMLKYKPPIQEKNNYNAKYERAKIFKQNSLKVSSNQARINKSKQKERKNINGIRQQMQNTCVKNELQNILMTKYNQKKLQEQKKQKQQKNLNQLSSQFSKMKQRIFDKKKQTSTKDRLKQQQIIRKLKISIDERSKSKSKSKSKSISIPKSPNKQKSGLSTKFYTQKGSPKKKQIKAQRYSITNNPIANSPTYIQKYLNTLQTRQVDKSHKQTNIPKKNKSSAQIKIDRYSHPSKSPQKKKAAVLQIKQHLKDYSICWSKEQFIQNMLKQCYVRRFLTQPELSQIYQQFSHKKVPRYQWEQKLIEKIFKKIHQVDDLI